MSDDRVIVASTNLDPKVVNQVALAIFDMWLAFATGKIALGGRRLIFPTGRYAASLQYEEEGAAQVAIFADTDEAPEAEYIEHGHERFDLKTVLTPGAPYLMHGHIIRPARRNLTAFQKTSRYKARTAPWTTPHTNMTKRHGLRRGATMWANRLSTTGFASFGPDSDPDSWILPPMRAYSPAKLLQQKADEMLRKLGG